MRVRAHLATLGFAIVRARRKHAREPSMFAIAKICLDA